MSKNKIHGPRLVSTALLILSTSICHAETFNASVKITLVNPNNTAQISEQQAMSLPIKVIENGQCTLDPQSGKLSGNACASNQAKTSIINIDGAEALNIAINLSETDSNNLHFSPTLYNGKNNQHDFALLADQHPVNIGGTITQSSALALKRLRQNQNAQLNYGIEVVYP